MMIREEGFNKRSEDARVETGEKCAHVNANTPPSQRVCVWTLGCIDLL